MIAPEGTTMRAISQQYAIPIQKLYRYNNFKIGQQPQKGEHIRLRSQGLLEKFKD
jgi:LysM repeat protein